VIVGLGFEDDVTAHRLNQLSTRTNVAMTGQGANRPAGSVCKRASGRNRTVSAALLERLGCPAA
jgi:hypothetical protein